MLLNSQRTCKELTGLLGFDCQAQKSGKRPMCAGSQMQSGDQMQRPHSAWALKNGQAWGSKGDGMSKGT